MWGGGQMLLNFAINVHHNVTQFPQDLTLHKARRQGICSPWGNGKGKGKGNGNKRGHWHVNECVNASARVIHLARKLQRVHFSIQAYLLKYNIIKIL